MRTSRIRLACGKVTTSPTPTLCPGLDVCRPLTRQYPELTTSAASDRDRKKRAWNNHLSSRSLGQVSGDAGAVLPANQILSRKAASTANGLSGSIGFSGRGGRASKVLAP